MIDNNRVLERIVEEIQGVIARMDENDLERAMALITKGSRIYAAGEGRSGFQARSFAMRMMHIGYTSYMMGETICPSMREGDVLLAISGSGKTRRTVEDAEAAKNLGVRVIAVTSKSDSPSCFRGGCRDCGTRSGKGRIQWFHPAVELAIRPVRAYRARCAMSDVVSPR